MAETLDVGNELAESLLAAALSAAAALALDAPGRSQVFSGATIPLAEDCEGMLWTRVLTSFPADATNRMIDTFTWDSRAITWAFQIEVGHLHCHETITESGEYPDEDTEAAAALRDNRWRMALMRAVYFDWRSAMSTTLARTVERFTLTQPYQPIGPEGGYSGGALNVTASARTLAIPGS